MMADPSSRRYSVSPAAARGPSSKLRSRSLSRSRSRSPFARRRSRSRSRSGSRIPSDDAGNPGNNLFVTGLSTRTTESDLEDYFAREGKVVECRLVIDARSRASRGFAFITMDSIDMADRCMKYLNGTTLDGRVITVERARRRRPRTPTPGRYLGIRRPAYGERSRRPYDSYRRFRDYSPEYSPSDRRGGDGGGRSRLGCRSPLYSPYRSHSRSQSRSHSPRRGGGRRGRYYSRSRSPSRSPYSR